MTYAYEQNKMDSAGYIYIKHICICNNKKNEEEVLNLRESWGTGGVGWDVQEVWK